MHAVQAMRPSPHAPARRARDAGDDLEELALLEVLLHRARVLAHVVNEGLALNLAYILGLCVLSGPGWRVERFGRSSQPGHMLPAPLRRRLSDVDMFSMRFDELVLCITPGNDPGSWNLC